MKISVALLSALLAASGALSTTARPNQREICGEGRVLSTETFVYDGTPIVLTTKTCPELEKQVVGFNRTLTAAAEPAVEKRQIAQCTNGGCSVECANLGAQPFVADCQAITDYLESQYPNEFLAPAMTISTWSSYSCEYAFINFDVSDYAVCYINFGFNAIVAAEDCFGNWPAPSATSGAGCFSPGIPGNDWVIEILYP